MAKKAAKKAPAVSSGAQRPRIDWKETPYGVFTQNSKSAASAHKTAEEAMEAIRGMKPSRQQKSYVAFFQAVTVKVETQVSIGGGE